MALEKGLTAGAKNKGRLIGAVILFLFLGFTAYFRLLDVPEGFLQDRLLQSEDRVDTRIVIVGIDDPSLEALGRWPWPRHYHGELLEKLSQGDPAVVGLDVLFTEPAEDRQEDAALARGLSRVENAVIPAYGRFDGGAAPVTLASAPVELPVAALQEEAFLGHINTFPDGDGIVRRTLLHFEAETSNEGNDELWSFAWKVYERYMAHNDETLNQKPPLDPWGRMFIDYTGTPGTYEMISYHQVLEGKVPLAYFEDKIVLIGPYTVGIDDYYFTPLARGSPMFGIEVHANILQQFLMEDFKDSLPFPVKLGIMAALAVLGYVAFTRLTPLKGLIGLIVLMVGYLGLARFLYEQGWITSLVYPMAYLGILYVGTLAYDYIAESIERRRVTYLFGRYVSPEVVEKILAAGEAGLTLGGERREVTVLFVDIRGFTKLSEQTNAETVVDILNDYLSLCTHSIFKYQGTLDKFMGDAAMAIFNAPLTVEDHAYMAVKAAWDMKEGSKTLQQKLETKLGHHVEVGIGINTGEAVIGNIGADFRMDYTAIGDTVNTASRLENEAAPGQILISGSTYQLVKDRVCAEYLEDIKVKGKMEEIPIYQVTGILPEEVEENR